jgi:hypothetical protein
MPSVRACGGWMAAAVVLAAVLTGGAPAAEAAPVRVILYTRDTLTVRVTGVPTSEVLEELSRQSGADIRGQVREPRDVTADFDAVPLPEALARLLGDQNFALVYGGGGRLKAIRVLGGAQPGTQVAASPPSSAPSGPDRPPFPGSLPALIDRHPPVPVAGALADAIGSPSATLRQLIDLSLHHEDPAVRAEALRTGIGTLDGDAELRSAVISELETADSAFLTSLLRSAASERSEDIATQVLRDTRFPEIRLKASSVLQRLRSGS